MTVRSRMSSRSTHTEPATATRAARDVSPYPHNHAGFSLIDPNDTRRGLPTEVHPR